MILCDTNVVIELFKGNKETIEIVENIGIESIALSSVTVMELCYGALNKRELNKIKKNINSLNIVQINTDISELAIRLVEKFSKSHGLQIPDAIIAATTLSYEIELFTYNLKDFKYIDRLTLINNKNYRKM